MALHKRIGLVAAMLLLAGSTAQAQDLTGTTEQTTAPTESTETAPPANSTRGEVSLDIPITFASPTGGSIMGITPVLGGRYQVIDQLLIGAQLGFAWGSLSPDGGDSQSGSGLANPYVYGQYTGGSGALSYHAGLGVALPLASDDRDAGLAAYAMGQAAYGAWNGWLWSPKTLAIVVPVDVTYALSSNLSMGAELAFAHMMWTGDGDRDANEMLQVAPWIAYGMGDLQLGARLQGVFRLNGEGDKAQLAIAPFATYNLGSAFIRGTVLVNLDSPYGQGDSGLKALSIHVGGGLRF